MVTRTQVLVLSRGSPIIIYYTSNNDNIISRVGGEEQVIFDRTTNETM